MCLGEETYILPPVVPIGPSSEQRGWVHRACVMAEVVQTLSVSVVKSANFGKFQISEPPRGQKSENVSP